MTEQKKIFVNSCTSSAYQIINMFAQYIARHFCILYIGAELMGVDSTILSYVNILALAEAGFSVTIIVYLVHPMQMGDWDKINIYLNTFRVIYKIIGTLYLVFGCIAALFLPFVINGVSVNSSIYACYFLNVLNGALTYFLSYRKVILIADQKLYVQNIINSISSMIFLILQICVIVISRNYVLYVILKLLQTFVGNLSLYVICGRMYTNQKKQALDKCIFKQLIPDVKNLLWGNVGGYIFGASDVMIISTLISTVAVSYYNNYYMVFYGIKSLTLAFFTALIPYIIRISQSKLTQEHTTQKFCLFTQVAYNLWAITTIPIVIVVDEIIKWWVGPYYLMPKIVAVLMAIDGYICLIQSPGGNWLIAHKQFVTSKRADMLGAIVNVVLSIMFASEFGIAGVLLGTIISRLFQWIYRINHIHRDIFSSQINMLAQYWAKVFYTIFVSLIAYALSDFFSKYIILNNLLLTIVCKGICAFTVTGGVMLLLLVFLKEQRQINRYIFNFVHLKS